MYAAFLRGQSLDRSFSCYILMTFTIVLIFYLHLFADDTNLFCKHKILPLYRQVLTGINNELSNVNSWLCANKLSLNIEKN